MTNPSFQSHFEGTMLCSFIFTRRDLIEISISLAASFLSQLDLPGTNFMCFLPAEPRLRLGAPASQTCFSIPPSTTFSPCNTSPVVIVTACVKTFSNSATFPIHSWHCRVSITSGGIYLTPLWSSLFVLLIKCAASSGISSFLSLNGGMLIVTPLMR